MNGRNKKALAVVLAALLVCAAGVFLWFQSQPQAAFSGDRVRNTDPERFSLRFDVLNTTDAETLPLQAGDTLRISWEIERGSVDILVAKPGEEPLYRADGRGKGDAAGFDLTIPASGDYVLTVTGRQAKGWITFEQAR